MASRRWMPAAQQMPDCVLLDWNMPVMNGIDFLKQLRAEYGPDKPPVVFCTTETEMSAIELRDHQRRAGIHHEAVRRGDPASASSSRSACCDRDRRARRSPASASAGGRGSWCATTSAVIRGAVARMLDADPAVQVVARVANGQLALDELKRTPVDVLVLDIEMPVMDGMTALPLLLRADPGLKVIMASTLTTRGADIALRALRLGAADYVPKPSAVHRRRDVPSRAGGEGEGPGPHAAPRRAAAARRRSRCGCGRPRSCRRGCWRSAVPPAGRRRCSPCVQGLGKTLNVPVVLTQHMPATFTPILAEHITSWAVCRVPKRRRARR